MTTEQAATKQQFWTYNQVSLREFTSNFTLKYVFFWTLADLWGGGV